MQSNTLVLCLLENKTNPYKIIICLRATKKMKWHQGHDADVDENTCMAWLGTAGPTTV